MNTALVTDPVAPSTSVPPGTSPIPFSRLLRVEWVKATDTRACRWLIGITMAATVLIMLAPIFADGSVDQTWRNYLDYPAFALTALLPVVAILTLTTEWTQRTALSTFTQEPRRERVLGAKVLVSLAMGVSAAVFGGLVTVLVVLAVSGEREIVHDVGGPQVLGFLLFVLINMLVGVAFGALVHNTAASIVLVFVVPTVFGILGEIVDAVGNWVDPGRTFDWIMHGQWDGHVGGIVVSLALWVAIPLLAGLLRTLRREIK